MNVKNIALRILPVAAVVLIAVLFVRSKSHDPKPVVKEYGLLDTLKPNDEGKVVLSEEEWKSRLSSEEFRILRQKGTERAFTGPYLNNKSEGTYNCAGCSLPLFSSDTKFKSGTGWPSFYDEIGDQNVLEIQDFSHGMIRTEIVCGRCDGHLGHVFSDGPRPTGLRYCVNGAALSFDEAKGEE